jgi:hypothetical protein
VGSTLLFTITVKLTLGHATRFASIKFRGSWGGGRRSPYKDEGVECTEDKKRWRVLVNAVMGLQIS